MDCELLPCSRPATHYVYLTYRDAVDQERHSYERKACFPCAQTAQVILDRFRLVLVEPDLFHAEHADGIIGPLEVKPRD